MPIFFLRRDRKWVNSDISEYGDDLRVFEGLKVIIRIYFMKMYLWSVLVNFLENLWTPSLWHTWFPVDQLVITVSCSSFPSFFTNKYSVFFTNIIQFVHLKRLWRWVISIKIKWMFFCSWVIGFVHSYFSVAVIKLQDKGKIQKKDLL